MTDNLRDKLINKGWVTPFNADTLVRLIEEHYAELAKPVPVRRADGVYWRWPEFSDCDDTDRVWCWNWAIGTWRINRINRSIHSHWLPVHALPVPGQEVEG